MAHCVGSPFVKARSTRWYAAHRYTARGNEARWPNTPSGRLNGHVQLLLLQIYTTAAAPPAQRSSSPAAATVVVFRDPAATSAASCRRHPQPPRVPFCAPDSASSHHRRERSGPTSSAEMGLDISELFSMAPLSGGGQPTEYMVPKGFNMGTGNVRRLQEQLIEKYESLATQYNIYGNAEGKAAHFGVEPFRATLDEAKNTIRKIRDAAVNLMTAVYNEGHQPLPPKERLDQNVAKVLDDDLMKSAALAASTYPKSMHEAQSSTAAEARGRGKCAVFIGDNALGSQGTSGRDNTPASRADGRLASERERKMVPSVGAKPDVRGCGKSPACTSRWEEMPPARSCPPARSKSCLRGYGKSPACITRWEEMPHAQSCPSARSKSRLRPSKIVKALFKAAPASRLDTKSKGKSATSDGAGATRSKVPKLVTRGAAARARAEASWDARAIAEADAWAEARAEASANARVDHAERSNPNLAGEKLRAEVPAVLSVRARAYAGSGKAVAGSSKHA